MDTRHPLLTAESFSIVDPWRLNLPTDRAASPSTTVSTTISTIGHSSSMGALVSQFSPAPSVQPFPPSRSSAAVSDVGEDALAEVMRQLNLETTAENRARRAKMPRYAVDAPLRYLRKRLAQLSFTSAGQEDAELISDLLASWLSL
ncbi:hypothetical protein LTR28_002946, partial [Elasticomyces elasticus]